MTPIFLDPAAVRTMLVGRGEGAVRRLAWLHEAGASPDVWSDAPSAPLSAAAGKRLSHGLPSSAEIASCHILWIVGLSAAEGETLARAARAERVLVNVEDVPALCDFHTPAVVRRGRLTLAAGTGGASPAVARAARERLETAFPPLWEAALEEIAQARSALRRRSASAEALVADARRRLARHGLA